MSFAERLSAQGLAIFLFHGVIDRCSYVVRNYTGKHILKAAFVSLLRQLKQRGKPVSLDNIVECSESGEPFPPHAFAITFDDGFANNSRIAAPILADLDIPATFYVTTGFIEDNSMSWIDRLEYCLELARPGQLRLPWNTAPEPFHTPADRIHLLDRMRKTIKQDPGIDVGLLVSDVFAQCHVPETNSSLDPLDAKMSWADIRSLHEHPNFTIGGHTHRHAILSFLSATELERKVGLSVELLRNKAGIPPTHYSYPEGLAHCYSEQVIQSLRAWRSLLPYRHRWCQ